MSTYSSILPWETVDRGTWQATVYGVTKESDRAWQLNSSNFTVTGTARGVKQNLWPQ